MESTRPIRALMRGLEALTVLNRRGDATVSEIAQEIRLPRTTVYRILETLCESGFVFRDAADERYRLTILVRGLSAGFDDEEWVTLIAKPLLRALGEQTVWPVHLATPSGTHLVVREATDQDSPFATERLPAGTQLPLLGSAAGRTYLAFCGTAQRDALFEALAHGPREEDRGSRARAEVQRALDDIRGQGYGLMTRSRRLADEVHLSVPVKIHDRTLAVLTVRFLASALPARTALERFLPRLQQCAAKISETFSAQQAGTRQSAPQTAA
jgi:IclR family transcriptional regulator, mhp operon transcriptional activator